jgi:hypothetical protein
MGLGTKISFHDFFVEFKQIDEIYLHCNVHYVNQHYFKNINQMIYVQLYLTYMLGFYGKQIQMHNSL